MSTIPPGTALDRAAMERVEALAELFRVAAKELRQLERQMRANTYRRAYLKARIAEAQRIIDSLISIRTGSMTGTVVDWARVSIPPTYQFGAGLAVRDLQVQMVAVTAGAPTIHVRAVDALIDRFLTNSTQIVIKMQANVLRTVRVVLEQSGFGPEIAQGIIGGLPRRTVSKQLATALRKAASVPLPASKPADFTHVEINGRFFPVETWAEMHARTELARASTAGTRVMTVVNGVRHVQITSHAHEPCICTPFEGRIYALEQGDPDFSWIGDVPNGGCPMHPNCVHREAPAVIAFLQERGEIEGRTRIPEAFVGLDASELARIVRENRDQLQSYSMRRSGYLPESFRIKAVA